MQWLDEFDLVTKQPINPIHGLNDRGILVLAVNFVPVNDRQVWASWIHARPPSRDLFRKLYEEPRY